MKYRHLILGAGNMARALIPGFIQNSQDCEFLIFTPSGSKAKSFADEFGAIWVKDLEELRNTHIDYLWACFKPQQLKQVALEIDFLTHPYLTIVSLLAGSDAKALTEFLSTDQIIRIMPNTPAQVGLGVNALYKTKTVHQDKWTAFWQAFNTSGINTVFENEDDIDTITPFSGSGPAYFFEVARILIEDMKARGIDGALAHQMVAGTIEGAGRMLSENSDAETLRNNVTSKNGVTYEALESFKESGMEEMFNRAIERAYQRTLELKGSK
ncbi:putative pyrroline-5-carboxylate reductase [Bacteriovorax sp. BAL6_X]|uniref:pyrroline-5-carboxylate reductase family protein n=1 Tax=Bacteriovorax sp. BAL6_X TaxID=1201290 RepID=UPI0003858E7D|nr:pyrroline-5-carboxylate reductase dimerization domain-containing protein [Bacteriovorax sp. BAL6_X]EPZ50961.1 putative pyrroline-5-carboxylate reductase [Bacteriovorax sp. BAL6_X]